MNRASLDNGSARTVSNSPGIEATLSGKTAAQMVQQCTLGQYAARFIEELSSRNGARYVVGNGDSVCVINANVPQDAGKVICFTFIDQRSRSVRIIYLNGDGEVQTQRLQGDLLPGVAIDLIRGVSLKNSWKLSEPLFARLSATEGEYLIDVKPTDNDAFSKKEIKVSVFSHNQDRDAGFQPAIHLNLETTITYDGVSGGLRGGFNATTDTFVKVSPEGYLVYAATSHSAALQRSIAPRTLLLPSDVSVAVTQALDLINREKKTQG